MCKKRILAIFGNVAYMGQERANVFVLDTLQKTGKVECLLAVNDRGVHWHIEPHLERAQLNYIKIRFPWNPRKSFDLLLWWQFLKDIIKSNVQFYRIWKNFSPDYIHCGNAFQMMTMYPVLRLIKTPVVFRLGDEPERGVYCWPWEKIARRIDQFVCNSRFVQNSLMKAISVKPKISLIYNYPPTRLSSGFSSIEQRIRSTTFNIIYVGAISADKGVDILVEAAYTFLKLHDDARLYIAGSIDEYNNFAKELNLRVVNNELGNKIFFLGMVENIPALFESGDLHVCPSVFQEPLSNVVGEAKLARRPSVIFPSGGLVELVQHKTDGYICKNKTSHAIVEAFEYYYNLSDWGRSQGEAAYRSMTDLGITKELFEKSWCRVYQL
jgi:glycosyltransferase involved in cell wall biosynthesis